MAARLPITHGSGVDLSAAQIELQRVQACVRKCQCAVTKSPLKVKDIQREAEICWTALISLQRNLEGVSDGNIQRDFRILQLDYQCLVNRIRRVRSRQTAPLVLHASSSSSSTRAYLSFPTADYTFIPEDPTYSSSIQEFEKVLKDLGLLHQLKVEVTHGDSPRIRFQHSGDELESILFKYYHDLRPYFPKLTRGARPPGSLPSNKALIEAPDSVARHARLDSALIKEADEYFGQLTRPFSPVKCTIPSSSCDSERNMLQEVYVEQNLDGLCIGENHADTTPKKFILDHLPAMAKMGVTTFFMEHLPYDTMQRHLDKYFASPTDTMPLPLEALLDGLDATWNLSKPYTYKALVRKAKSVGIRVVGIDTSVSRNTCDGSNLSAYDWFNRLKAMNYVAQKIIQHEKGDGKYLVLLGVAHGSQTRHPADTGLPPPGVATLLQIPFFAIEDSESGDEFAKANAPIITAAGSRIEYVHLHLRRKAHGPGVDLSATQIELQRVQACVRKCQCAVTKSPLKVKDIQGEAEICKTALVSLQKDLEGVSDENMQRDFRILRRDYECLVNRIRCVRSLQTASLVPHASSSSSSTQTYLSFPTVDYTLIPVSPTYNSTIVEYEKVLRDLGLLHQLRVEVTGGDSPSLRFQHSENEIGCIAYAKKYGVLKKYFHDPKKKGLMQAPDCAARLACLHSALIKEADEYYGRLTRPFSPVKCTIPSSSCDSERNMLQEVFVKQNFDGLCIGEGHSQVTPKKFILDHLPEMAKMGVTTFFIETLPFDTMQRYLDEYFASPSDTLPLPLEALLGMLDCSSYLSEPYTYKALVRKAKSLGIRIVGIDTQAAAATIEGLGEEHINSNRRKAMNYVAQKIIKHEKGDGKYLVFLGAAHGSQTLHEGETEAASPGVATLLQIPFFVIDDFFDFGCGDIEFSKVNVPVVTRARDRIEHAHLHLRRRRP